MRAIACCLLLLGGSAWAQRAKGIEAGSVEFAVGADLRACLLLSDPPTAHLTQVGSGALGLFVRMNKLLGNVAKVGVAFGGLGILGGLKPGVSMIEWQPLTTYFRVGMGEGGKGLFLEIIPLGVSLFTATVTYPVTGSGGGSSSAAAIVATTSYSSYRFGAQAGYRWRGLEFSGRFEVAVVGRITMFGAGTSISFYFFPW